MAKIFQYPILIIVVLFLHIQPSFAALNIEITKAADSALPIAIVPFGWKSGQGLVPVDIAEIVAADLERSGQFKAIPPDSMLAQPNRGSDIKFENWRIIGVENVVVGNIELLPNGTYRVDFQLFDVLKARQLVGQSHPPVTGDSLRAVAHKISDIVYKQLTGEQGAFNTRIAYITSERLGQKRVRYSLEIADTDGYNAKTVIKTSAPILSPSWSPDGRYLAYVSFENDRPEVFIHSVSDAKRQSIASFTGINGAPVWSPNGRQLALTLSRGGNPDIYILDLRTKQLQQITKSWAIDTEPVWTPDGKAIIFTSGRGGGPQIYKVSLNGGKPERLTFEGNYNASPAISPDGRSLAMVHRNRGRYQIALLDLKNQLFRVLTDGSLDESPSFAPNGSIVLYASQRREQGVLAAVSIDGRTRQRLAFSEGNIREPTWGPYPAE